MLKVLKYFFFFLFLFMIVFGSLYLNFTWQPGSIGFTFFDEKPENGEIKNFTETLIRNQATTFYSFLTLSDSEITKIVHEQYEKVNKVKISKGLGKNLTVTIIKNEEFFYTCVPESFNFLAKCMLGNSDGEYYSSLDNDATSSLSNSKLIQMDINKNVLFDSKTGRQSENPDSLSGTRIYSEADFKVLGEILKWIEKNAFQIKKVYVDELKIVDIYTDLYMVKVSLDKGYVETVKDFELVSKTGGLEKYINEDKNKIRYIDLSYKNKVFYKLKGGDTLTSTSSTSTIATSTKVNE